MVNSRDLALEACPDPKSRWNQSGERWRAFPFGNEERGIIGRPFLSFKEHNNSSLLVYNTTEGYILKSESINLHNIVTKLEDCRETILEIYFEIVYNAIN